MVSLSKLSYQIKSEGTDNEKRDFNNCRNASDCITGQRRNTVPVLADEETTLVYGSGDYTRINPAMDEHGEINILIFNGLTAHDGDNQVVPGLAESWEFDDATNTYTFHMAEDAKWQDGEPVTADDVKFTIEAIMDPENGSENAPNYEDVEEINVIDDHTVAFKLEDKNVAFLDYMTMAVLPKHLLEGEDMQTSDFFRNPIGTGPYKIESWMKDRRSHLLKMKITSKVSFYR